MMLCSRCKKRPAVVFITAMQGDKKKNDGLCLVCAKEMHVPQIDEYMKQMGISDEELEQISNQMMDMMDGDSFEMGGSGVMPQFLQNMIKDTGKALESLQNGGVPAKGDEDVPQADYTEVPDSPPGAPLQAEKGAEIPGELLHQSEPACCRRKTGCSDRTGQGNRTCDSDSVPPHQKQSLSDR